MNILKRNHFDYVVALIGYLVIAIVVLAQILLSPGTVGFFHDWFIGPYPEMNEYWANNGVYKWDRQIGNKVYDSDWIFRLSLLSSPFLGGEVLSKGLLLLSITMSGFGTFCLCKRLSLNSYICFATGVLYVFSPIVFTRIVAGYIYYLIAYFLSPIILESFLKGKEKNNNKYFILSGLLLSFAIIQIQFLPMIILIIIILSIADFKRIKKGMIGLAVVFSISFLITLSPLLFSQLYTKNFEIPFNPSELISYFTVVTSSDLSKSFRILGYEGMPYSYLNIGTDKDPLSSNMGIIPQWIFYLDFILPITGFSVLLFRRDVYAVSFAVISMIGLYFLKGLNPPFPEIFTYFFLHGFYIFREVWHIAFLYGLSITLLFALFLERLTQTSLTNTVKAAVAIVLISLILISNGYPLFLGNFAGYLQTYQLPNEYHKLYTTLLSDTDYNVLVLPYVTPIRYDALRLPGIDPMIIHSQSMIFPTILGNRASPTISASTWLLTAMQQNATHNLGKLLSGFGIKYVILRTDFVSEFPNYTPLGLLSSFRQNWYASLTPILEEQRDMKLISNGHHYKIYENLNIAKKIFVLNNAAGGLSDFNALLFLSNVTALSNVALYHHTSGTDIFTFIDDKREANMPLRDFMEVGPYSNSQDAGLGWTSNRISFGYDYLLASRVRDGLFTSAPESDVAFNLPAKYNNKELEIWLKVLSWNQGGPINIQVDNNKYSISLFSEDRAFRLVKIYDGKFGSPLHIILHNLHGRNYVEGLYLKDKKAQEISTTNKSFVTGLVEQNGNNLVSNPLFSESSQSGLPRYWMDLRASCSNFFNCTTSHSDGWDDKMSLQLSTTYGNRDNRWSWIYGLEIQVSPRERYELVTHMKLNEWATESHVALEGFNETSQKWYQIEQCPAATSGPLEWTLQTCEVLIPSHTTKVRPVLNAGWSFDANEIATTWFDAIYLQKIKPENQPSPEFKNLVISKISDVNSSSVRTVNPTVAYSTINPTLWNLNVQTTKPTIIGFAEPYDQNWQATIYKDGKKLDVVKSLPLYGTINSFEINHVGNLFIVLTFAPQTGYQIGLMISGITFVFCVSYMAFTCIKERIKLSLR